MQPQKDAKKGRFLTFLIPIGNKECAKAALILRKTASPLCARQGDGRQGWWPGLMEGERQNVYLKRFPQPPTHGRKAGARRLWAFLCVVAGGRWWCGTPFLCFWRATVAVVPGGLARGLCKTIPFAGQNHTFRGAKGMVSQAKTIRIAKRGFDAANIINYKKRRQFLLSHEVGVPLHTQ